MYNKTLNIMDMEDVALKKVVKLFLINTVY